MRVALPFRGETRRLAISWEFVTDGAKYHALPRRHFACERRRLSDEPTDNTNATGQTTNATGVFRSKRRQPVNLRIRMRRLVRTSPDDE